MGVTGVPRSQINQGFQLGKETSPGVAGTANQRLGTFNSQIAVVASGAFGVFRPSGGKYVGQIVPTDTYAEGPFTDTIDFNTVPFLLAGNVGLANYGVGAGQNPGPVADSAYTWVHDPVAYAISTAVSYKAAEGEGALTVPVSVPGAVYNYSNVIIPDLNMRFMRSGASQIGGRLLGRRLPPSTDFAGTATTYSGRSINPVKTGVYEGANWAAVIPGGTPTRISPVALDIAFRHNGLFAPWFALDDSINSFAGTLEQATDSGVQITLMADVSTADIKGVFNYAHMEDGSRIFLKVLTTGPLIGATSVYSLTLSMCLQISGPPRRANVGPLRVWQWDALFVPNTVGVASELVPFRFTVINSLPGTALAVT